MHKKAMIKKSLLILMMLSALFIVSSIDVSAARLTLIANGGTFGSSKSKGYSSSATQIPVPYDKPYRKGYGFAGWYTKANGSGERYTGGQALKLTKNRVLYAKWTKGRNYFLQYDGNGGSTIPETIQTGTGWSAKVIISKTVPARSGYKFKAWNTKANGKGKNYKPGSSIIFSKPSNVSDPATIKKLYAIWDAETKYVLHFDSNGGTTKIDDYVVYSFAKSMKLYAPVETPTRDGYSFVCWNRKKDGSGTDIQPGEYIVRRSTAHTYTLFAKWEKNQQPSSIHYSIHFDANGGTLSGNSSLTKTSTSTSYKLTIPSATATRSGYTFKEWNTKADGTGTGYQPGSSVALTSDTPSVTLYAIWTANPTYTYKIALNGNGGTLTGTASASKSSTSTSCKLTVPSATAARSGYTFKEWNTKADGTGTSYQSGSSVTLTSSAPTVTLYAIWISNPTYSYKITLNGNGGTLSGTAIASGESTSKSYTLTVPAATATQSGYTFKEWNTKADGTGIGYQSGSSVSLTSNTPSVTLYAIWTANPTYTYKITLNGNGGTLSGATTASEESTNTSCTLTVPSATATRSGYTLLHWNTKRDGTGVGYSSGTAITLTSVKQELTLYAIWKSTSTVYTLKFDGNGVNFTRDDVTKTTTAISTSLKIPAGVPMIEWYTFKNWNTKKDGTGTAYNNGASVTMKSDNPTVTLYAIWEKREVPKITSLQQNKGMYIAWNAISNVEQYEVRYSKDSSFSTQYVKGSSWEEVTTDNSLMVHNYLSYGTWYVQVRALFDDYTHSEWSDVKTINLHQEYSYSIHLINPYDVVYRPVFFIKTNNPNPDNIRLRGDITGSTYAGISNYDNILTDICGRENIYCEDYGEYMQHSGSFLYKVKGGYVVFTNPNYKSGQLSCQVCENTFGTDGIEDEYAKTGVSITVNCANYDAGYEAWMNEVISKANIDSTMSNSAKLATIAHYLFDNYYYHVVIADSDGSDSWSLAILLSEYGEPWQTHRIDSLEAPTLMLRIAEKLGISGITRMTGDMHAYVTDGTYTYGACPAAEKDIKDRDSIQKIDLSAIY